MNNTGLFIPDDVNTHIDAHGRLFFWKARVEDPNYTKRFLRADPAFYLWASETSRLGMTKDEMIAYWSDPKSQCVGVPAFGEARTYP